MQYFLAIAQNGDQQNDRYKTTYLFNKKQLLQVCLMVNILTCIASYYLMQCYLLLISNIQNIPKSLQIDNKVQMVKLWIILATR